MDAWVWILIVIVVAVVLLVVVLRALQLRRRHQLRDRFGPEYDRAVETGPRRKVERELDERTRERDRLDIRPLSPGARERYTREWQALQTVFVDRPETAVRDADELISKVMNERGYPVEDFEEQAALVSVDHPQVVENYRSAHGTYERHSADGASTEELRKALVSYRSLFEELVTSQDGDDEESARRG